MKTGTKIVGGLLPLALLAVILVACENDMDVLTPSDAVLNLWANPASIVLDPTDVNAPRDERGKLIGSTTIFAQLFDKNGYPLENHVVYFSTDGGRMGSQGPPGAPPTPVETDANGIARDSLTVPEDAAASVKVTAQSSQVTKQVTVTKQIGNCTPQATVTLAVNPGSGGLPAECSGTPANTGCDADLPTGGTCPSGKHCCPSGQTCDVVSGGSVEITLTATATGQQTGETVDYEFDCGQGGVEPSPGATANVATCEYTETGTFTAGVTAVVHHSNCDSAATATQSVTISRTASSSSR